ncbi:MAG TPA: lipopolysaccharide kinase InaA family protein [Candidatus Acidoferrales bacterium]|nr:lipopolysaccharide kinase InaA family protein [Candidatus Acidoferrales bacterium]
MAAWRSKYELRREAGWRLLALPGLWTAELWKKVVEIVENETPARHPHVTRFYVAKEDGREEFYLKTYYSFGLGDRLKDFFRASKAVRALKQAEALEESGFHTPRVVAAGEQRKRGVLWRAFLLTAAVDGLSLPKFLDENLVAADPPDRVAKKREGLRLLAAEIARLHACGFVHGDLVPYNILVRLESGVPTFFLVDNDRTRRYPSWLPQRLWRRNLVQLNRIPLPGVFLQDRVRFLKYYLAHRNWNAADRRLLSWLERRTRERRAWRDRQSGARSFRELMKWDGRRVTKEKVASWPL